MLTCSAKRGYYSLTERRYYTTLSPSCQPIKRRKQRNFYFLRNLKNAWRTTPEYGKPYSSHSWIIFIFTTQSTSCDFVLLFSLFETRKAVWQQAEYISGCALLAEHTFFIPEPKIADISFSEAATLKRKRKFFLRFLFYGVSFTSIYHFRKSIVFVYYFNNQSEISTILTPSYWYSSCLVRAITILG